MRVVMIGLDCATPQLLFGRHADDMPTLTRLRQRALWGPLESTVPPITVPARSCMLSGRAPGEWLWREGLLALATPPSGPTPIAVPPTLQRLFGLPAPGGQRGRVLV